MHDADLHRCWQAIDDTKGGMKVKMVCFISTPIIGWFGYTLQVCS
jgi:hypothetical protein